MASEQDDLGINRKKERKQEETLVFQPRENPVFQARENPVFSGKRNLSVSGKRKKTQCFQEEETLVFQSKYETDHTIRSKKVSSKADHAW
ncbi:hypothetical protein CTI12_AA496160 [Artemisia annua]|uniref:Uncharacterized protein n=1 Tax=Artemisia annua TaxID=35608 RepID=A0A2U1LFM7_ARTAN|nr:hypothetical protein CTI12_AA496160 [Artemisia annua]